MAVELSAETRKHAIASLRRYTDDELEVELSDIQLIGLLNFMLKEIGPAVYNKAVIDAQAFLQGRLADLEATCYEPEFVYWSKGAKIRRK